MSLVSQAARESDTPMPFLSVLLDRYVSSSSNSIIIMRNSGNSMHVCMYLCRLCCIMNVLYCIVYITAYKVICVYSSI